MFLVKQKLRMKLRVHEIYKEMTKNRHFDIKYGTVHV